MTEMGLRWLVREEWKPAAGPSIEVFNALSGSHSVDADDGWHAEETLPANGAVEGEVIGLAQVESYARLDHYDTVAELVDAIEERGQIIDWKEGWPGDDVGVEDDPATEAGLELLFDDEETEDDA